MFNSTQQRNTIFFVFTTMIDYISFSIQSDSAFDIGEHVMVKRRNGAISESRTPHEVRFGKYSPCIDIQWHPKRSSLRIGCSPASVFQCHNVFGSNDLRFLVKRLARLVCRAMNYEMPTDVAARLKSGDYVLHQVDVTEAYRLDNVATTDFFQAIRRQSSEALRASGLPKGTGVKFWPNSRTRSVLLYDKSVQLNDKSCHLREMFVGASTGASRDDASAAFDKLKKHADGCVRIEVKLKQYLKNNGLAFGSDWTDETARKHYLRVLSSIPIETVRVPAQSQLLEKLQTDDERMLFGLWLESKRVAAYCQSKSRLSAARNAIRRRLNIDIAHSRIDVDQLDWCSLIDERNIVEVPEWANEHHMLFDRKSSVARLKTAWNVSDSVIPIPK